MAERQVPPVNGQDPEPVVPQPGVVVPELGAQEVVGPDDMAAAAAPWPQVDDAEVGAAAGEAARPAVIRNEVEAPQQAGDAERQAYVAAGGAEQPAEAAGLGAGRPDGAARRAVMEIYTAVEVPQQAGGDDRQADAAADGAEQPAGVAAGPAAMEGDAAQPAEAAAGAAAAGGAVVRPAGAAAGDAGRNDAGSAQGDEAVPDAGNWRWVVFDAVPADQAVVVDENAPPPVLGAGLLRNPRLPWAPCEVRDIDGQRRPGLRGLPMWNAGNPAHAREIRRQRALRELPHDQVSVRDGSDGQPEGRPVGVVQPNVLRPDAPEVVFQHAARALRELRDIQRENLEAADAVYGIARGAIDYAGELQEALESAHESSGYPVSSDRDSHSDASDAPSSRVSSLRPKKANGHVSIGVSISQSQTVSVAGDTQTKAGPKARAMAEYRQQGMGQDPGLLQEDNE